MQRGRAFLQRQQLDHPIVQRQSPRRHLTGNRDCREHLRHRREPESCPRAYRDAGRAVRKPVAAMEDGLPGPGQQHRSRYVAVGSPGSQPVVEVLPRAHRLTVAANPRWRNRLLQHSL